MTSTSMKITITKDILSLAKLADKKHERPIHIFPDGKMMATDGFSLIEVNREHRDDEWQDAPVEKDEWLDVKKPILISPSQVVEKQKFEKKTKIPILEKAFLLKGKDEKIILRTTNLDTTTDVHYRPSKDPAIEYENIFPEDPKQSDTFDVVVIANVLSRLKEMGISEVTFMRQEGERKPLILFAKEVRALIMPRSDDEDKVNSYKEIKNGIKKTRSKKA